MVSHCGSLPVIEFLASIEPASIPLLAVLAFSISLYPLGLMLGSPCSACCEAKCDQCETGSLPDAVTVTFSGYPDTGPPFGLLTLEFTSCYGSGAAGTAQVASQPGPITGTTVTNGGSGFAKLGRVEPTVTADGTGGAGADITVTLTEEADACGIPYWTVSGLTVVDGGENYDDGGVVVFSVASGDTAEVAAYATVITSRGEPELTVEPPEDSGSGATFTVTLSDAGDAPDLWEIDSITVTDGGSGYSDGDFATVGLGSGDVEQSPATLIIRNVREEPELTLIGTADLTVNVASLGGTPEVWEITSVDVLDGGSGYTDGQYLNVVLGTDDVQEPFESAWLLVKTVREEPTVSVTAYESSGEGAVFNVTVIQSGDVWIVDDVEVINGGVGYSIYDFFALNASAGQTVAFGFFSVTVDENGTITAATISSAGEFFLDSGVIEEVEVLSGGRFFKDTGVIESVSVAFGGLYYKNLGDIQSITLAAGGRYYREDTGATPYVADIDVTVVQQSPSSGTGAQLSAVVDDSTASPTFGRITAVTVDDGGSDYVGTGANNSYCMAEFMNKSFVLARGTKWTGSPGCNSPSNDGTSGYTGGLTQPALGVAPCEEPCKYAALTCTPLQLNAFGSQSIELQIRNNTPHSYGGSGSILTSPEVGQMVTTDVITDCSNINLTFTAPNARAGFENVTAVVASGGSLEAGLHVPQSGACGVCCLDQDESPQEITMSLTNLTADEGGWYVADGDYVLTRSNSDGHGFSNGFGRMHWTFAVEGVFAPVFGPLAVTIAPCSYFGQGSEGSGYVSGLECEDVCYKKCFLIIRVPGPANNSTRYYGGCVGFENNPNLQCLDFPVCKPSGTYSFGGLPILNLPDGYEVTFL